MPNGPLILNKNYVNADDTIASDRGGTVSKLYARNKYDPWISSGANNDATSATLEITFKEGASATNRIIDTIALLNHNLTALQVYYYYGGNWVLWIDLASSSPLWSIKSGYLVLCETPSPSVSAIRLVLTSTIVANQEKSIGQLVVSSTRINPGDFASYQTRPRAKSTILTFGDNSICQVFTKWAGSQVQKYEALAGWTQVTAANWRLFEALKESAESFWFIPEPDECSDVVVYVAWVNALPRKYTSSCKGVGLEVSMEVREL